MIGDVANFLKNKLSAHLEANLDEAGASEDQVVFISGDKTDPINFKIGSISMMLVNVEEENILRDADPYIKRDGDGNFFRVQSSIRLNLFILFVSRFKGYRQSLNYLSQVIQYFQRERVFIQENESALPNEVEKLILEMITLPFSQQNEVWSSLRTTYLPSVLYKIKMVVFRATTGTPVPQLKEKEVSISKQ